MNIDSDITPAVAPTNPAIAAMQRKQQTPGDVVYRATADLPEDQRSAIRRMHSIAVENDWSNAEVGEKLRVSDSAISLVFRGKYEAGLGNITKAMRDFIQLHDSRREGRKLAFIRTKLYDEMETICDKSRTYQKLSFFFGDSQIGKSENLKYYKESHNHGNTVYVEMPTGGALIHFLTKLCDIFKIGAQGRETDMRRRILSAFDDRMLLIVDEAHRCIPDRSTGVPRTAIKTVDFIKELFNERQCGVVLCATNVFLKAINEGEWSRTLEQLWRRRWCARQLPAEPSREDLNIFADSYGLPPSAGAARDLEEEVIGQEALGRWLNLLRTAAVLAKTRKSPRMTWDHVHAARSGLLQMEKHTAKARSAS